MYQEMIKNLFVISCFKTRLANESLVGVRTRAYSRRQTTRIKIHGINLHGAKSVNPLVRFFSWIRTRLGFWRSFQWKEVIWSMDNPRPNCPTCWPKLLSPPSCLNSECGKRLSLIVEVRGHLNDTWHSSGFNEVSHENFVTF